MRSEAKDIIIISDANVIIDYLKADENIIKIATATIFDIYIPIPVLKNEIDQLSEAKAKKLGIKLYEPTLEEIEQTGSGNKGLSFNDKLCLQAALKNGWICSTNDKPLRKECGKYSVKVLWGLEIMIKLNALGYLAKSEAIKTVNKMKASNVFITDKIQKDFIGKLK